MDELSLVTYFKKHAYVNKNIIKGIGDDCALFKGKGRLAVSSDLFIENIHFRRGKISFKNIGKRAAARALSDLAACAAEPVIMGASLGAPKKLPGKNIKEIFLGINEYARKFGVSLCGGDTSEAEVLFLDIWVIGQAENFIFRSTARRGDSIFITGKLGAHSFNRPFSPRIKEALYLAKNFKINAMIDISDGLFLDLYRLLSASKKGALIYKENIPFSKSFADAYRGEDYELLFTVDKREKNISALEKKFFFIGKVKPNNFGIKIKEEGKIKLLKPRGYRHFQK